MPLPGKLRMLVIFVVAFAIFFLQADSLKPQARKALPAGIPTLWQEPEDIATRDLYLGPGGEANKPDLSRVTFVKKKSEGYSTKYVVKDGAGKEWVVKLGKEAQPDTVASRLLWAVGYSTDVSYLAPSVTIEGEGTFANAKFEARPGDVKRIDEWSWDDNPFIGTKEFQGLKVMMILINNWDIKDENTKVLVSQNPKTGATELHYIVSDLGGSFGRTGNPITRSRNEPEDFHDARFVELANGDHVVFNYNGKRGDLFEDITPEQVRWIAERLARLSEQQIRDAFRAGNYAPEEVETLTEALTGRIRELVHLSDRQIIPKI